MGYPIQLVGLEGQRVLVVGGGPVAAEKVAPLVLAGADVHVIALEVGPEMRAWLPRVGRFDKRAAELEDVRGAKIVVAATDDATTNRSLVEAARARGILAQAADDKPFCDFYSPAVVRRGPVMMTISTDGGSPLLAGQLRRLLEAVFPRSLSTLAELLVAARARGLKGLERRGRLLRTLFDPAITRLVDAGDTEVAADHLERVFSEGDEPFEAGAVAIVGAGPGSRQLLTLRALDRIQRADILFHDALVEPEVLELALPGTEIVDVGRRARTSGRRGFAPLHARRIPLMLEAARAGKRVVRLHGGDPFVFGRGGEEVEALTEAGIPWEVVPGVSAVNAAAAALGTPLTRRRVADGISVRTGHVLEGPNLGPPAVEEETVVILMGLGAAPEILEGLIREGRPSDTPAAAVGEASRPDQRVVVGTLATLADRIRDEELRSPVTMIVGEVVRPALDAHGHRRRAVAAGLVRAATGVA